MEFELSELRDQVMTARAAHRPLFIRGGGTKQFYGETVDTAPAESPSALNLAGYKGIVSYEPSELVITARAGTLLSEIEAALHEQDQMLAFEPPRFGADSTIGGCVASGLSGPRRMAAGSVRDFVLGARLLDSSGSVLRFGGEVMKNVAGYDMSRLLAGSMGIFGALVEVSIKVAPKPFEESTLALDVDQAEALDLFNTWRALPLPISASAWIPDPDGKTGRLHVRLSGSEPAVHSGTGRIGGLTLDPSEARAFWDSLRDQTHPFFQSRPLWRVALPPQAAALNAEPPLIEWNGGLRWLAGQQDPNVLREQVKRAGGHATLYRYNEKPADVPVFHPLEAGLMTINRRLKHELDPAGIFNPKRLFPEF